MSGPHWGENNIADAGIRVRYGPGDRVEISITDPVKLAEFWGEDEATALLDAGITGPEMCALTLQAVLIRADPESWSLGLIRMSAVERLQNFRMRSRS